MPRRNWQPATDVRGAFLYLTVDKGDTVRVVKRQGDREPMQWTYEIYAFDVFSQQFAPYRVPGIQTADTAIANAKALARGLGMETRGVR